MQSWPRLGRRKEGRKEGRKERKKEKELDARAERPLAVSVNPAGIVVSAALNTNNSTIRAGGEQGRAHRVGMDCSAVGCVDTETQTHIHLSFNSASWPC